jgi:phosphoglycerate dehydrogenase-like enzyme
MEKIIVVDPLSDLTMGRLRGLLPPGFTLECAATRGDEHMKELIADADYAISGQVGVSGPVLRAAKKLKLLHKWGVGVDNLDVATARELGIRVARTTGSNAVAVAEFTLGLIFATFRQIAASHARMQAGEWRGIGKLPRDNFLLSGKTVGLVGFGSIGKAVAKLLAGFGCRILYSQRTRAPAEIEAALNARHVPLSEVLAQADVVSLHCPLTPETENMIDAKALASMKPGAILINVARGGVVVETDLIEALEKRTILAAAMDVFSIEPLPPDSPLIGREHLVLTPHLAASVVDLFEPVVRRMYANIEAVAKGGEPAPGDIVV